MTVPLPTVTEALNSGGPPSRAWRAWFQAINAKFQAGDLSLSEVQTALAAIRAQLDEMGTGNVSQGEGIALYGTLADTLTIALRALEDSGVGGALLKITRDQYGRVEGTEPVTPADMLNPFATYLVDENGDYLTDADGNFLVSDDGTLVQDSITDGVVDKAPSQNAVFDALAGKYDKTGGNISGNVGLNNESPATLLHAVGPNGPVASLPTTIGGALPLVLENNANAFIGLVGVGYLGYRFYTSGDTSTRGGFDYNTTNNNWRVFTNGVQNLGIEASAVTFRPDNTVSCGTASFRISEVFSGNATINTSDAREKTAPRDLTSAEVAAALDIARLPCIFQWLHAIEAKGEAARLHASPTVQSVMDAMQSHGLDPFRYGFVCYDQWGETPEVRDEWPDEYDDDGNLIREAGSEVVQEHRPAGDRYSLRQGELAAFIMRALVKRQDDIEARLAALGG